MKRLGPIACVLAATACAAPVLDVDAVDAPLVRRADAATERSVAELPAGCEDRLPLATGAEAPALRAVSLDVLSVYPELAVARIDGVATCVDAVPALVADLTLPDGAARGVTLQRYELVRSELSEGDPPRTWHTELGTPWPTAGTGPRMVRGDPHPTPLDPDDDEEDTLPADAAKGDPHPTPLITGPSVR
ncbi:MAG: hypothetical protein AAGH15_24490 [Myxococcota bacterium]